MLPAYWSYVLSLVGAVGTLLLLNGRIAAGAWIGLGNQFLWASYAVASQQTGFWFSVALYGPLNLYGLYKNYKKRGKEDVDE